MSYIFINNFFIGLLVFALIFLVVHPKIEQPCYADLLSVLGAVFGVAQILTSTDMHYSLEGTSFRVVMCTWCIYSIYRKWARVKTWNLKKHSIV